MARHIQQVSLDPKAYNYVKMARWIRELSSTAGGMVGDTIIAGWWPTTFHRVMTWEVKIASATEGISVLTRQLYETKGVAAKDFFVTVVHKTDRWGVSKSEDPDYEIDYLDRAGACEGHRQIVAALMQGKRSLNRLLSHREGRNQQAAR
jgi:hypothetical protein